MSLESIVKNVGLLVEEGTRVVNYLQKYGYLAATNNLTDQDLQEAVTKLCNFLELGNQHDYSKILRVISRPRCAVADILPARTAEARWKKNRLTYYVEAYVGDDFSKEEQNETIQLAFDQWSKHANIKATRANSKSADIIISVGSGRKDQFDGESGTLAWAYLPNGNDSQLLMKFDAAETWIKDPNKRGILLLNVACHEIGHLFGLDHSKIQTALMAPYYDVAVPEPKQNDDVSRIVNLYGKAVNDPTTPPPTTPDSRILTLSFTGSVDKIEIPGWRCSKIGV